MDNVNRNYNSISPSAKSLLWLKGHTNIPFARRTAELMLYPDKFIPDFSNRNMTFWARVLHFEKRYWSIDQLLADLPVQNILEISSGFSFRGLEIINKKEFHYIDTDLQGVIDIKKNILTDLLSENNDQKGIIELLPLNALDPVQFEEIVSLFPDGEIAIVNEGLLMYLDSTEKEKLCNTIYKMLKKRGGYWITADIYLKHRSEKINLNIDPVTKKFFEQHRIEENKFESFDEAESFFRRMGFRIDKRANIKSSELSSLKYFMKSASISRLLKIRKAGNMNATWRLTIARD